MARAGVDTELQSARGPLSRGGLTGRLLPFAVAAIVFCTAALVEPETLREPVLLAAALAGLGLLAAAYLVPWDSLPLWTQVLPPLACLLVLVLFSYALGGHAGVAPAALLPVVWLALYGAVREFAAALGLAAIVVALLWDGEGLGAQSLALAVLVAMMALPLYRRIRHSREQLQLESLALSARAQLLADPGLAREDICAAASQIAGPASAWLLEPTAEGRLEAVCSAGTDIDWIALQAGEPSGAMSAFMTGEGRFVSDSKRNPRLIAPRLVAETGAHSVLFEPVHGRDRTIAVLVVAWERRIRRLSDPSIATARLLAAWAGSAIEREEHYAELDQARKDAERARDAKSELLTQASHDLRTPLTAILGYSTLARRQANSPELERSLHQISQAGRYMDGLVTQMVEMQLSESGRLKLSPRPMPLDDFISDACALVELRAEARQVTLTGQGPSRTVLGDRERLIQVVVNLIGNAVEASPPRAAVTVRAQADDDAALLRLSVTDEGPGIPEDQQQWVFEPFTRLTGDRRGYGLGLAIVKGMVDAMGGAVLLESAPGRGSTFSVELPLVLPAEAEAPTAGAAPAREAAPAPAPEAAPAPEPAPPGLAGHGATVLYIEDNVITAELVERVLEVIDGARFVWAETAGTGLELARALRPDLILVDLALPDLDGRDLVRRLRADTVTAEVPLVAVSASADIHEAELRALGVTATITKPFEPDALVALVRSMLRRSETPASLST